MGLTIKVIWNNAYYRFLIVFIISLYITPIMQLYTKYDVQQYNQHCAQQSTNFNESVYYTPQLTYQQFCDDVNNLIKLKENPDKVLTQFFIWLLVSFGIEEAIFDFIFKRTRKVKQ